MSAPVITGIDVVYPGGLGYKLPGQTAELFVHATDADALTITVTVSVTDSAGNTTTTTCPVVQSDPLTYSATTVTGHTVTQDPSTPNHFYVV